MHNPKELWTKVKVKTKYVLVILYVKHFILSQFYILGFHITFIIIWMFDRINQNIKDSISNVLAMVILF